jgi:hypothetical protein
MVDIRYGRIPTFSASASLDPANPMRQKIRGVVA